MVKKRRSSTKASARRSGAAGARTRSGSTKRVKKAKTAKAKTKKVAARAPIAKGSRSKRSVPRLPRGRTLAARPVSRGVTVGDTLGLVGRAAGFDTGSYPGDAAIKAWAASSPYAFVGFYFDAPCHTTTTFKTWSRKVGLHSRRRPGTRGRVRRLSAGWLRQGQGHQGERRPARQGHDRKVQGRGIRRRHHRLPGRRALRGGAVGKHGSVHPRLDRRAPGRRDGGQTASIARPARPTRYTWRPRRSSPRTACRAGRRPSGSSRSAIHCSIPPSPIRTDCGVSFASVWQGLH